MVPLRQEIRIAARTLFRAPLFSIAMVLTIALGIGANTAVFSVTNAVLIRPLPFEAPDRLVWIASVTSDQPNFPFSLPEFLDYREQATTLDALMAFATWSALLRGDGPTDRLQGIRISSHAFDVLGVKPAAGRLLRQSDDDADAPRVAVLAFDVWQRRFGGRESAVGTVAVLNGEPFEIVGVLPRHFTLSLPVEVVVPLAPARDATRAVRRSVNSLRMIGRLRSGMTPRQAERELETIAGRLRAQYPDAYASKIGVSVRPLHAYLVRNHARGLTLLTLAVAAALLIACGNLVNLLLARAATRAADVRVRLALGAGRLDVWRALWIETFQLSAVGALLGVTVAWLTLRVFVQVGPPDLPRLNEVGLDRQAIGFAAILMLVVATLLALAPLWEMRRGSSAYRLSARDGTWSGRGSRIRQGVIVGEMALAVVLLMAATLLLRSFEQLQNVDPGFPVDGRVMARIALPRTTYRTPDSMVRFADRFGPELERIPGVRRAGGVNVAPLSGVLATVNFSIEGKEGGDPRDIPSAHYRVVTDHYLATLGVPLLRGRTFSDRDNASSVPVALINRHLAETMFAPGDAVGRRILITDNTGGPRPLDVVGVVGDVRQMTLDAGPTFEVYVPVRQVHPEVVQWLANNQFWVLDVPESAAREIAAGIRRALDAVDPAAGLAHVRPLEEYIDGAIAHRRFATILAAALAGIALALAIVGLYGVMAYSVAQRTREMGLRSAIGATRLAIWWLIARSALGMLGVGAIVGLLLAAPALRPIESVLFETELFEPGLMVAVIVALATVGLIAAAVPAWRAARIDPVVALRE